MITPPAHAFLCAPCPDCRREVLATRTLDEQEALGWRCLHCEAALDPHHPQARWLPLEALEEVGCFLMDAEPEERHGHGEEGGCRGGACGVRQPAKPRLRS